MIAGIVFALALSSTSAPDEVIVYPDRAQVRRTAKVACGNGVAVVFENVPPAAAAESFRAFATPGNIDGLRAELITREKEFSPKAEGVQKQIDALGDQRRLLQDARQREQTQAQVARKYADIATTLVSREMVDDRPNPRGWAQAYDASLTTGLDTARRTADLDAKLRDLSRKDAELRREMAHLQLAAQKRSYTVDVLVSCKAGQSTEVTLSYMVGGSRWTPEYEARAQESKGTVAFATYATVLQGTGEDWSNVKLTLSTAIPSQNATPPDQKKLVVTAIERAPEKKVLVRRDEYVDHARTGSGSGGEGKDALQVREQGQSVQLVVPDKSKVPGDGNPVRLFVGRANLKGQFELRAIPRLVPVAFRVAELSNQLAWPLLPGRVDAYRETGLVGRYSLERVAQGAAFSLTFGVEDHVRVKRTVVDELKRDTGLFNSKKRFTYAYRFELANYGPQKVEVTLSDTLPVSEQKDIEVSVSEKTTPGYTLDKTDGIARWKVPLSKSEKKNVDLRFQVDVPDSYETGGL